MGKIGLMLGHLRLLSDQERGAAFERYVKWFLENDAGYSSRLKTVWLWSDWPGKWGRDKGIDLIAETHDGKLWAIQAKAYHEDYYVKKDDIDSFLSESSRADISYRLLVATTNKMGDNARGVIRAQEKQVGLCLLHDLSSSGLDWSQFATPSNVRIQKPVKIPYPHQEKALSDILAGFENSSYGQLYMACGTGKTLVGLWLAERLKSQITLVLVPSIALVAQLYREWFDNCSEAFNFDPIFVCSDKTVRKRYDEDEDMHSSELGFPVTTNAQELVDALLNKSRRKVIFSTYHSSPVIAEACKLSESIIFDLVIADEAHRCAGADSSTSDFATVVDKNAIRAQQKLFMTATPRIFSDRVKETVRGCDREIVSMDDIDAFGPIFHKLLFSDAIRDGLLSDYQVIISVMNHKMYREYAEKGRFVTVERQDADVLETDARTLASQLIVAKAMKEYGLKRVISFHSRKKGAQEFVDSFPHAITMLPENEQPCVKFSDAIFGTMMQYERCNKMKQFEQESVDGSALLANVRCLSEGVDVPALDGIAFIDPKGSEIDIVQAVGRVIRKSPEKKMGTVIIPIYADDAEDPMLLLEQSCFKVVGKVVRALRAHDDILAEEIDAVRLELGKRTYKSPPKLSKIKIDVLTSIGVEFAEALKIAILEKVIENCASAWQYNFNLLKEFRVVNPHKWPSVLSKVSNEVKLAQWCGTQRSSYNRKKLSQDFINLLGSIGFSWDTFGEIWYSWLQKLKDFRSENPERWPSQKSRIVSEKKLGSWCSKQRQDHKDGCLEQDKIDALNEIGFCWDQVESDWFSCLERVQDFLKKNHRLPSSKSLCSQERRLGMWCGTQRQAFKGQRKNGLNSAKVAALKSIGFTFDYFDVHWDRKFEILIAFRDLNPHRWPTRQEEFMGVKIGEWCHTQRKLNSDNQMTPERKIKLAMIDFPWGKIKVRKSVNGGYNV